jgi:citrate synthase
MRSTAGEAVEVATARLLDTWRAERGKFVPGFGHRFHKPEDPRTPRLLSLLDAAVSDGVCAGFYLQAARAVQAALDGEKGRPVPMNVDGATAVVYAELGFAPPLARGLFLSVPLGRRDGARLGADAAGRAQQRPDPAALPLDLHRRQPD